MRRRLSISLIAIVVALSASATAQAAGKKAIWGPVDLPVGSVNCPAAVQCSAFPAYAQLGVDTFQVQINWDLVAPSKPSDPRNPADPAYRWPTQLDAAVEQGAAFGIEVAALVQQTPAWANGGRGPISAPTSSRDFGDFLFAASRRYPSIRKWMIWGEPNRAVAFQPNGRRAGPRAYARLLSAAFTALKSASPSNVVIGGMTVSSGEVPPPRFIRFLQVKGKMPPMDLWGHNPFDGRFPQLKDRPIRALRGLNDIDTLWDEIKLGYEDTPKKRRPKGLFLSEWVLPTDHPAPVFGDDFFVSREEQARRIRAAYRMINRLKYVKALGYFTLLDQPPGPATNAWGLMTHDGVPKPGFFAYASAP